jgi:ribonuclease HI
MLRTISGPIALCLPSSILIEELRGNVPAPLHLEVLLNEARSRIITVAVRPERGRAHSLLQRNPLVMRAERTTVVVASDGSYHPHEHNGAWAWTRKGHAGESGYIADASSALACEIVAATHAIAQVDAHLPVILLTDSRPTAELINYMAATGQLPTWLCIQLGTKASQVEPLAQAVSGRYVTAKWVRGHDSCKLQNRADVLARKTRRKFAVAA